jgi:hypothetical protein
MPRTHPSPYMCVLARMQATRGDRPWWALLSLGTIAVLAVALLMQRADNRRLATTLAKRDKVRAEPGSGRSRQGVTLARLYPHACHHPPASCMGPWVGAWVHAWVDA